MKINRKLLRKIMLAEIDTVLSEKKNKKKRGKGCANTVKGCTRRSSDGSWYILNNKEGGVWRSGFKTKAKALKQLGAIHGKKK